MCLHQEQMKSFGSYIFIKTLVDSISERERGQDEGIKRNGRNL